MVLAVLDVATTAAVFSVTGPHVEGNPVVSALVPIVGAYGALMVVLVCAKLPLSYAAGVLLSRLSGRRAAAFTIAALAPLILVVVNNLVALLLIWRMI